MPVGFNTSTQNKIFIPELLFPPTQHYQIGKIDRIITRYGLHLRARVGKLNIYLDSRL